MKREEFIKLAKNFLGSPAAKYAGPELGNNEKGFDCSGFVGYVLRQSGFPGEVPRHCNEYFDGFGILVHKYRPGDLIFFAAKSGGVYPEHMGIVISKDEYIHSPGEDGKEVEIKQIVKKKIAKVRGQKAKQIYLRDPIGFKRIANGSGRYRAPFLD